MTIYSKQMLMDATLGKYIRENPDSRILVASLKNGDRLWSSKKIDRELVGKQIIFITIDDITSEGKVT